MRFDLQRAFPYPVRRPGSDDYVDGEFQASARFEVSPDEHRITATFDIQLSVDEITDLVEDGRAEYAVVIECRNTFFRHVARSATPTFSVELDVRGLRGFVQVDPFIVATEEVRNYTSPLLHDDWKSASVSFPRGGVLAVDTPQQIVFDREAFRPVSSVFKLVKKEGLEDRWNVSVDQDHVHIELGPNAKEDVDRARNSAVNRAVLLNSLFFAAVMHCLDLLREGTDYDDFRWAQVIRQQIGQRGLSLDTMEPYEAAQALLNDPLKVLRQYVIAEEG